MLTQEENDLLTRVGPGTPGGELMRRYWQPVALVEELPRHGRGAPLPLRILGEDLTLFRDDQGRIGLLGLHCSHRAADLSYGRVEDDGLRCLYHGWLYDIHGNCLEQPGEPAGSRFHEKIRHTAYPCIEKAGLVFAYMGPGEPPLLPAYEALEVDDDHRWVAKYFHDCSYLQGNEGNQDPTHPAFLHGLFDSPGGESILADHPKEASQWTSKNRLTRLPVEVDAEETDYGIRGWAMRLIDGGKQKAAVIANFIMPNLCAVQGGPGPLGDGYLIYWHVPVDDTHHWRFAIAFKRSGSLDPALGKKRTAMLDANYRFPQNPSNRYGQDREEMKTSTFAGFGTVFVTGDHWATETAGAIQDRTKEHLGAADREVSLARRVMLRSIRQMQEGGEPIHVIRAPEQNDLGHIQVWEETFDGSLTLQEFIRQRGLPTHPNGSMARV